MEIEYIWVRIGSYVDVYEDWSSMKVGLVQGQERCRRLTIGRYKEG